MNTQQTPTVGRVVHYVSDGTPGGASLCRAATITQVKDEWEVDLAVFIPTGMFFNHDVIHDPGDVAQSVGWAKCVGGERVYPGGTWHWPERA